MKMSKFRRLLVISTADSDSTQNLTPDESGCQQVSSNPEQLEAWNDKKKRTMLKSREKRCVLVILTPHLESTQNLTLGRSSYCFLHSNHEPFRAPKRQKKAHNAEKSRKAVSSRHFDTTSELSVKFPPRHVRLPRNCTFPVASRSIL